MAHFRNTLYALAGIAFLFVACMVAKPSHGQTVTPISQLPAATTPLSETEILPIVQAGVTKQTPVTSIFNGASPGPIGTNTPSTAAFTNLSSNGLVSGSGFANYLASPPTIGGSVPGSAFFSALTATNLTVTGAVSGSGFSTLVSSQFASPPALGSVTPAAVTGSTVTSTSKVNGATGLQVAGTDLCNSTLPTVSGSGLGTGPVVVASNDCAADVTVGTSPSAASFTITLPAAPHGWVCSGYDITSFTTTVFLLKQIGGGSTTTCVMEIFSTAAAGVAPVAADHLKLQMLPQ